MSGNSLLVHLCSPPPSAHHPRGDWSPHGGQSLGALARRPVLSAVLHPARDACQDRPPYLRFPLLSQGQACIAWPPSEQSEPGARRTPPQSRPPRPLRLPGSPCRTASSAPATDMLPPRRRPPPSDPANRGPRRRQVSGRHQPQRLSGPLRHRLRRP